MRLSVVIPTLNAAQHLPRTLAALSGEAAPHPGGVPADTALAVSSGSPRPDQDRRGLPPADSAPPRPGSAASTGGLPVAVLEIIVADGGSTDATRAVADAAGASVLHAPRGRGAQLAAGIAAARAPWLLLLHADTRLSPGWADAVARFVADPANAARAGYFRFALDSAAPQARRLERAVAWRSRALGLPYGDQGLLLSAPFLAGLGGVKTIPLMEDVDLVRRIGRRRLVALDADAVTSAEKWERQGWTARSARNLLCLALWFAGVPPRLIRRLYG